MDVSFSPILQSRLLIEPDHAVAPVHELIVSAKQTLLIKQFTFTHSSLMQAVVERKNAGVRVRIMLNPHRSSGDRANDASFEFFQRRGVSIQWANPQFAVTHEKSIVVDGKYALIATFNLAEKYFTHTRDYGVIVEDAGRVSEVIEGFEADWNHHDFHPRRESGLLWSNANAREIMSRFIDDATTTLHIQHPKFVDATLLDRILHAAQRGVKVRVLCGGKHGISAWDILDTFSSLRVMHRAGIHVHKQKNLRLHAKLVIVDGVRALLGSMNIDRSAFDLRRELGAILKSPDIVSKLSAVFEGDWLSSHRYEVPDPLDVASHQAENGDFLEDSDLFHE